MQPIEAELIIGDMHFAAKHWGNPAGKKILALHGWLDNAASFDFLAPLLPDYHWVCLDLAGQGKSDHRVHFGAYNIWQDVTEVFAIADALQWDSFSLVGHSRGAVIAALACGTFPERIEHLALIEGIATYVSRDSAAPELLASAYLSLKTQAARPQSVHASLAAAIAIRADGKFPVSQSDAQALAARGVEPFEGGYTWAYDYKLLANSEVRFTLAQLNAFFARIKQPVHLLIADNGIIIHHAEVQHWLATQTNIAQTQLPGGHHLHMSENCLAVSQWLQQVLASA
jgi:pimeloyl-ACP methyl ester carboxylesterase